MVLVYKFPIQCGYRRPMCQTLIPQLGLAQQIGNQVLEEQVERLQVISHHDSNMYGVLWPRSGEIKKTKPLSKLCGGR